MAGEFCPSCGASRTGSFRFCRGCGFDFDASAPAEVASPARARTPQEILAAAPVAVPTPDPAPAPAVPQADRYRPIVPAVIALVLLALAVGFGLVVSGKLHVGPDPQKALNAYVEAHNGFSSKVKTALGDISTDSSLLQHQEALNEVSVAAGTYAAQLASIEWPGDASAAAQKLRDAVLIVQSRSTAAAKIDDLAMIVSLELALGDAMQDVGDAASVLSGKIGAVPQ